MESVALPEETIALDEAGRVLARAVAAIKGQARAAGSENGASRLRRLEVRVNDVEPLGWLHAVAPATYNYWSDRHRDLSVAGVGEACVVAGAGDRPYRELVADMQSILCAAEPWQRFYGGIRFRRKGAPAAEWEGFGDHRFVVPRYELSRRPDGHYFACTVDRVNDDATALDAVHDELLRVCRGVAVPDQGVPRPRSRNDVPDFAGWKARVERILGDFRAGRSEKIVLARQSRFEFDAAPSPLALLRLLADRSPRCYHFCLCPHPAAAFLGVSPERLYEKGGDRLMSEAVAGTRPRGRDGPEDRRLGEELLASEKDIREHRYVTDAIGQALASLCRDVQADDEVSLLKFAEGQHLFRNFSGTLHAGVSQGDVLDRLHPTPAVGGVPRDIALAAIDEIEGFDRGWYAGPVGWLAADAGEFAVAIRSGLVRDRSLSLFSGAGIVAGSTPEGEWDEIEHKIGNFVSVFS